MKDRCPKCGASYALVGLVHRCAMPVTFRPLEVPLAGQPIERVRRVRVSVRPQWVRPPPKRKKTDAELAESNRNYMRLYMKNYRARKKNASEASS